MSGEWFECVCQFLRAQSENLSSVLEGLGNQNTISDIGGMDTLALPEQTNPFAAATPMHFFMIFLAMIWAWLFIFSKTKDTEKPANPNAGLDDEGASGSDGPSGNGGGGGTGLAN